MKRNWVAVLGLRSLLMGLGHGALAADKDKDNDPAWVLMIGAGGEWPTPELRAAPATFFCRGQSRGER
jgi:hypothetical protein